MSAKVFKKTLCDCVSPFSCWLYLDSTAIKLMTIYCRFTFIHLADAFIQSDLELLCKRLNASGATRCKVSSSGTHWCLTVESLKPKACVLFTAPSAPLLDRIRKKGTKKYIWPLVRKQLHPPYDLQSKVTRSFPFMSNHSRTKCQFQVV